jgi:PAS domain S-box-containing protein
MRHFSNWFGSDSGWATSIFSQFPSFDNVTESRVDRWFVICGGLGLILSRVNDDERHSRFGRSLQLFLLIRSLLKRRSLVVVAPELLAAVFHEVSRVADPMTLSSLRSCFVAARDAETASEEPCQGRAKTRKGKTLSQLINLRLLADTPWDATSIGAMRGWSPEMRQVVQTALHSAFPIWTAWGEDAVQIYNDGYNAILGDKHPSSFGAPAAESWPEIWEFLQPALATVRSSGEPLLANGMLMPLAKQGRPEECYFDFSYSVIPDARGDVIGVMSIATERTAEKIAERRQSLNALVLEGEEGGSTQAIQATLRELLAANQMDAQMAVMHDADAATGPPHDALWRLRWDATAARALGTAAGSDSVAGVRRFDIAPSFEPGGHAGYGHQVTILSRAGRTVGTLALVPNVLVPESSHFEFVTQLSVRLHAALHKAQARAEKVGTLQETLAARDIQYQFLFDNMEEAAFYTATDGHSDSRETLLAANAQACRMLGYQADELAWVHREALFFPDDQVLREALAIRSRTGSFLGDLVFRRRDGSPLPVELSSRLTRLRSGEMRSVSIARDISQRRAKEKERAERARFESMVQLTGGIAHDFNNYLTVIMGSLDALNDALLPGSPVQAQAANALLGAERAASLTSQLLSYAKRQTLQTQPLDLREFMQEVSGLLASTLGQVSKLDIEIAPALPVCELDPAQMTSALLNLVVNARDTMPQGGTVTIRAGLERLSHDITAVDGHRLPAGKYICLTVADTGTGISPLDQQRIFEPFYSTKASDGGSGLGLAMVQGFVRQSGGDVRAVSEPGRGARFELLLPALSARRGRVPPPPQQSGRGEIVLVVENNEPVREQTADMLRACGFRPLPVADAESALSLLRQPTQVDFLLVNLTLPSGVSGLDLAKQVRSERPGLPVLLTTGASTASVATMLRDAGLKVLPKPFVARELACAINEVLRGPDGDDGGLNVDESRPVGLGSGG